MKQLTFALLILSSLAFPKNLALKNFMEIYSSLQVSTNLKPTKELVSKFIDVKEVLPQHGILEEYTTPMQLGLIKLAGDFCHVRVTTDAAAPDANRWLHHGVDFSKEPSTLTEVQRKKVIAEYTEVFWQRAATADEEKSLLASYDDLAKITKDAKAFFSLYCIGFGSSMNFLLI